MKLLKKAFKAMSVQQYAVELKMSVFSTLGKVFLFWYFIYELEKES